MKSRPELRAEARLALDNGIFNKNWLMAVVVLLIYSLIVSAASSTLVLGILLVGPMTYGISSMFLDRYRRKTEEFEIGDLFKGFSEDFGGLVLLGLMKWIFTLLWSLLCVVPGIVKTYAYSQAFYLKADHIDWDWKRCLEESSAMMEGHKWELFVLDLSFIGWVLLGSLCCGVGSYWVSAYIFQTRAAYYDNLKCISAASV